MVHKVLIQCFIFLSSALSAVINYHDVQNRPSKTGICVANHTSPIDVLVLMCDYCYSLVSTCCTRAQRCKCSTNFFIIFFLLLEFNTFYVTLTTLSITNQVVSMIVSKRFFSINTSYPFVFMIMLFNRLLVAYNSISMSLSVVFVGPRKWSPTQINGNFSIR